MNTVVNRQQNRLQRQYFPAGCCQDVGRKRKPEVSGQVLGDTFEGEQVEKLLAEADLLKDPHAS